MAPDIPKNAELKTWLEQTGYEWKCMIPETSSETSELTLRTYGDFERQNDGTASTSVVNIHHGGAYDIYIGRPGKGKPGLLGNPIVPGGPCPVCGGSHGRNQQLLDCYRRWLFRRLRIDREYRALVRSCHGKALGCFCKPGPCHGDVLVKAALWLNGEPE